MDDEYIVREVRSDDPEVLALVAEQRAEVVGQYGPTLPVVGVRDDVEFLVLRWGDAAVGCVGLQPMDDDCAEIKRMYVQPAWRGLGLSRLLLTAIEQHAVRRGFGAVLLETGDKQLAALELYRRSGYREIPRYPPYEDSIESICFARTLRD